MDNKKEFLTEENYERGKKKVMGIALIILIVGILLGGTLITVGIIKTNEVKKQNAQVVQEIEQNSQTRTAEEIQADIDILQQKIDSIGLEIDTLESEQTKIFTEDMGFSDRYNEKDREIKAKKQEQSKLENEMISLDEELWKVNSGYNDSQKEIDKARNTISTAKYAPLYVFGGFIIVASCMIAFSVYIFGKRRDILAFTTQQVMPVAQGGIEKVAPTLGKARASMAKEMAPVYGDMAKEISKGIKEGLKDDNSKKE